MNHVAAQILDLVARLFPGEFAALDEFCDKHAAFLDEGIQRADQELQFYIAYLDHIGPLRSAGLHFCYPEVSADSKDVLAVDTFDMALADKLVAGGKPVVTNEFRLQDPERVFVVTGPNRGARPPLPGPSASCTAWAASAARCRAVPLACSSSTACSPISGGKRT